MSNKKPDPIRRLEDLPSMLYMLIAVAVLAIHVAICTYTDLSPSVVGFFLILLYGGSSLSVFFLFRRHTKRLRLEAEAAEEQRDSLIRAFRDTVNLPYALLTEGGMLVTSNAALREAADLPESSFGTPLSAFADFGGHKLSEYLPKEEEPPLLERHPITMGGRKYVPECAPIYTKGERFHLLTFHDVTELSELHTLYHNSTAAIAYVVLDNLDELAQYVKVSYQTETREVEAILRAWAVSMNGMILEYDRNKYMLLFSREEMAKCIKTRFDVLDRIRNIRLGNSETPITVSMGISVQGKTMAEREKDALDALDTALLRGGDQAVLKNENGTFFFGGRTKSPQKKSRMDSRVILPQLTALIQSSPNVIVMGHSHPDFDSIGACVGLATLAMHLGKSVKIVADTSSENFRICTARLCQLEAYKNIFVDGTEALALSSYGTLLIVADANRYNILEAPELANDSRKTAVIDHHIKQESEHTPQLSYIEPTASSASELVSELLEVALQDQKLQAEVANVMLAGIMVDTKNFTRNVGPKTFAAALYLRSKGANPEYVHTFFEQSFEDYRSEAHFGAEARIYRDQIAITALEGAGSAGDRVSAAKSADRLLNVRNVNAAFALIQMGDMIHISARSNGAVNVQWILEKIGGGGHFDMAGAALQDTGLAEAERILCQAIDEYFEENKKKD